MKKKQKYEQPRTEAVELRVTNQLLAGSTSLSAPTEYGNGGNPLGPSESRELEFLFE